MQGCLSLNGLSEQRAYAARPSTWLKHDWKPLAEVQLISVEKVRMTPSLEHVACPWPRLGLYEAGSLLNVC